MFELKATISAPALEAALNALAAAIASSTNAGVQPSITIANQTPSVLNVALSTTEDDEDGAGVPAVAGEVDAWGITWDASIHSDAKEKIAKTTGQWKKKKGVEETFFINKQSELIQAAVAAGTYKGPAELVPKPEGYVAPVLDPATTTVAVPTPPATTTATVPAPPVTTTATVPAPPATTVVAPVNYTHDTLQAAVMKMFSNPAIGANAGVLAPKLLALYGVAAISDTPTEKIESFVKLVEAVDASPATAVEIVSGAETKKAMGVPF